MRVCDCEMCMTMYGEMSNKVPMEELEKRAVAGIEAHKKLTEDHWLDAYRYALGPDPIKVPGDLAIEGLKSIRQVHAWHYWGDDFDEEATSEYDPPRDCSGCNKKTTEAECITISYPSTGLTAEVDYFCFSCTKPLLVDISYRKKNKP